MMRMVNSKASRWFLAASLFLGWAGFGCSMSRPLTEPVLMEFVRVVYEKDAGAIVAELVVPNIDTIEDLSRIELLICHANGEAQFGLLQVRGDYCDPVPPGNFGVIIDPGNDDRSIKNVLSAGPPGCWDYVAPHGTILKQSACGVVNGNLGISVWIVPKDWNPDRYVIKTRAVRRKHRPSSWQRLATFEYTGEDVEQIIQNRCLVKPVFMHAGEERPIPLDYIRSVILIRYERQPQDEGVTIKRWAGDTSGQYKYVEKEKKTLNLSDFPDGLIPLEPGVYQFNHNSVYGQPPSGFYGKSNFFEIKAGEETAEVQIPLNAAI